MGRYRSYIRNRQFIYSALLALVLLCLSIVVNYYAGTYATRHASNAVTDVVLDNIPTYDVDGIFVNGGFVLVLFIAALCITEPRYMPFTVKTISVFVLIRSVFILRQIIQSNSPSCGLTPP